MALPHLLHDYLRRRQSRAAATHVRRYGTRKHPIARRSRIPKVKRQQLRSLNQTPAATHELRSPQRRSQTNSPLLTLPPELRNKIYDYALVETEPILVTTAFTQPPLLRICSQVRSEALPMWYTETYFTIPVVDCNGEMDLNFRRHHQSLQCVRATGLPVRTQLRIQGPPNWGNLMAWLRGCYMDKTGPYLARKQTPTFDVCDSF